ncbi:DNA-binding response regulator [Steroidobacter agaridevorans]|uniref:DNA-binding response regulator n=1 Tax=Steroidobacter agaridevorans TaxID=2695856 RepID=A0A829YEV9_9GAMM|nr:response regulator transcription factor [Steroidobacter agaridevorans]GFE81192.1 DNA-binding response regulator [Steroidobacter agaridevorans]GFE88924.1 DNA-binding response regulator [Steroidobacter agaridevorans]
MSSNNPSVRPIRVLAIDDHPLLREGIAATLAGQPDMQLVAEAASARAGIEQFRLTRPDVTLMDLQMPDMNGIDAIRIIREEFPDARILVLTTFQGDAQITGALRAGACGFMLKDTMRKALRDSIRTAHAGRRVIPPDVATMLAEHLTDELLSLRELDVLRGAAQGNANKRIAADLGISEDTVKAHMKNILAKLGANDRTHAVVTAVKRGIIEL